MFDADEDIVVSLENAIPNTNAVVGMFIVPKAIDVSAGIASRNGAPGAGMFVVHMECSADVGVVGESTTKRTGIRSQSLLKKLLFRIYC